MAAWFWYAVVAAVLYGAHQIFTRIAADHIGEGLGGFVVEASAAFSILIYLRILWFSGRRNQKFSTAGFNYSLLTGICVGAGTIAFFLLFQKGGPLSSVPAILAGGAAIMAIVGILFFREPPSWQRIAGVALALHKHVTQRALSNASLRPKPMKMAPIALSSTLIALRCLSQLDRNSVAFVSSKNQRRPSVA
jgi:bacterial/archaeal transporter family protein